MNIDQFRKDFQMSRSVANFSNLYCGAMTAIILTAIALSPMHYREKAYIRGYVSVLIAEGNLLWLLKRQSITPNFLCGIGSWLCTISSPFEQGGGGLLFFGKMGWYLAKSAWKIGHAIRLMDPGSDLVPAMQDILKLDEKYIGGKPCYEHGVKHKRDRGTEKQ